MPYEQPGAQSPAAQTALPNRRQILGWTGAGCLAWQGVSAQAQPVSAAAEEARAPALPAVGSTLTVPPITLLNGDVFDATTPARKPLLVYWWASTCPFCALQSPAMEKLWRAQQAGGLRMVALSIDRKPQDAQAYLKAKGYTFPAAWASPEWRQRFPKPKGLPITLLIGTDQKVMLAERGQMFEEDVLAIGQML